MLPSVVNISWRVIFQKRNLPKIWHFESPISFDRADQSRQFFKVSYLLSLRRILTQVHILNFPLPGQLSGSATGWNVNNFRTKTRKSEKVTHRSISISLPSLNWVIERQNMTAFKYFYTPSRFKMEPQGLRNQNLVARTKLDIHYTNLSN